uniref:CARMIL C-terminal domain-containing protein n=1 Tax=Knipowitschia caucasica TaxID=637954 RepID=A0AAV2K208_KNICA
MGAPYRDEVQWDVDTIYLTQDTKELSLHDFIHLDNKDLVPIIAALEYNQWFNKLSIKDYKLPSDVCDQILRVVSRSSRLEELLLDNTALRSDFAVKFAAALSQNPASALHSLTLSSNSLEDKGVSALSSQLAKLPLGLRRLNLSRTGLSAKGVNSVCQALGSNPVISSSLKQLDLSGNSLRGDDMQQLLGFLSQSNSLQTLDLSHCDGSVEQICCSLLRGNMQHLSVLNLSRSVFSHRKSKEISSGFKEFFSSALALSSVSLSETRLPLDALKALLLGLGCNPNLRDVSLDLSSCDLRSAGSQVLEGCIAEIPNITSLDISDNGLDLDLVTLLVWLSKNRSIRHLALGKNFSNIKSKNLAQVLDGLVHLIQVEDSPLSSLSLADSRLKSELSLVLNALGSNSSVVKLDISGNSMGDIGAKMLAKALQINTKLRTLVWDRNGVSAQGLQDVASALEKNFTIRFMPVPIVDAAQALKANPEKTEAALLKMEKFLLRNHETRKYLQEQAYRLQQGIVTTTTQQVMDCVCVKVQDHLNSLRFSESSSVQQDVTTAQRLMQDARSSKTLLPSLYHLQDGATPGPCVKAIQDTLHCVARDVARVMDQQMQSLLEQMVSSAQTLCPHVMQRTSLRSDLLQRGAKKRVISEDFICSTLLEQTGVDLCNKISEVKLNMASFLSDRIVDEILESLSQCQSTLSEHVKLRRRPLEKDTPSEPEVIDKTELQEEVASRRVPNQEVPNQEGPDKIVSNQEVAEVSKPSGDSSSSMMKSKRKSILVRMLRPVSVAFEMEFDLDKALEEVPIHMEDPLPANMPLDRVTEAPPPDLPPLQIQTLDHQTKSRPKPNRRTKPTKAKCAVAPLGVDAEHKLDEGLDDFFCKSVSKLHSGAKQAVARSSSQETRRKSGFFNYIKSRTSRSEKNQGVAAITPPTSPSTAGAANASRAQDTAVPPGDQEDQQPSTVTTGTTEAGEGEEQRGEAPTDRDTNTEKGGVRAPPPEESSDPDRPQALKPAAPPALCHMRMPVRGMGLMAEMKAKLAAQKFETKTEAEDPGADVSAEPVGSRPEPAPRSRDRTSTGSTSPTSPTEPGQFPAPPLPVPRLKRALSQQDRDLSVDGESASDSVVIESMGNESTKSRAWSSLKRNTRSEQPEEKQRAKSLPHHVRPGSLCSDPDESATSNTDAEHTEAGGGS